MAISRSLAVVVGRCHIRKDLESSILEGREKGSRKIAFGNKRSEHSLFYVTGGEIFGGY